MSARKRVAVLASGRGSNLQALIEAARAPGYPAQVALVVTNVPGADALEKAKAAGIETAELPHARYPTRAEYDRALAALLQSKGIDIVVLAGFMRLLGPDFLHPFAGRVLNIHPALLPAFPGMHAQRQAFEYGVKVAGCTAHFVDEGTDTGPIIAQTVVPVLDGDDEAALSARILVEEHKLLPQVVGWVAEGRVTVQGRRVRVA